MTNVLINIELRKEAQAKHLGFSNMNAINTFRNESYLIQICR